MVTKARKMSDFRLNKQNIDSSIFFFFLNTDQYI